MCGLFHFGGRVGVGVGHGFAAFQEEGGLCSPPMSHGRETSNVCKHPQPRLCFLVLHPSPHLCRLNPPEKIQMLNLKAKAEAVGSTTIRDGKLLREREAVPFIWTPTCERQDRTLHWVYLSPNQDMIWVVQED